MSIFPERFEIKRQYLFENVIKVLKELYKVHETSSFVRDAENTIAKEEHLDEMLKYIMKLERDSSTLEYIKKAIKEDKKIPSYSRTFRNDVECIIKFMREENKFKWEK
jgi:hypothetical protein